MMYRKHILPIYSCIYLLIFSCNVSWTEAQRSRDRDDARLRAEETDDYFDRWLKQDVAYIITNEEKAVFQQLTTAEEKEQFIEQFWQRRDPDPRSAHNEFKEEHYRRIAYANEHYESGDPGWMTDRGRVYIMFGQPDAIESRPTGGTYVRPIGEGGGVTSVFPYEKWRYRQIEGLGQDIELEFVDTTYTGKFQLAVFPWEKDALMHSPGAGKTLAEEIGLSTRADRPAFTPASGGAMYGPQQMFASRVRDNPFARYELVAKTQAPPIVKYADLKEIVEVDIRYATLPFSTSIHQFRLNQEFLLVPVSIQVPNRELTFREEGDAQVARVAVYGIVKSMTNRIVSEFEDDFTVRYPSAGLEQGLQRLAMYQKILTLEDRNRYRLDLVLKDLNSGKVGVFQQGIIPARSETRLQASSLVLASLLQPLNEIPTQNDMFVLGDVRVLPNLPREFRSHMPLGVYLQVYNVEIDQQALVPSLEVTYKLLKDGELLKAAVDQSGESNQLVSDQRIVLVKHLSLEDLEPGRYELQVEVLDRLSNQTVRVSSDFRVLPDERAALGR